VWGSTVYGDKKVLVIIYIEQNSELESIVLIKSVAGALLVREANKKSRNMELI
jgi:hypothetical protein